MGLLSDSPGFVDRSKSFLKLKAGPVGFFLFLAGLIYAGYVVYQSFDNQTYFSENALLPGLVDEEFQLEHEIFNLQAQLQAQIESETTNKGLDSNTLNKLKHQFLAVGLETYVHNFTLKDPLTSAEIKHGHNIFGFVRSSRGASIEAMLVVVDFKRENLLGLSIVLALAKHCRNQIYWAKDIVFVLAEHGEIGILAWLNAYYERYSQYLLSSNLEAHGGAIQAAVILDASLLTGNSLSKADVQFNMLNGQLPNLDFVNLAVKMLEKQHILPTVYGREQFWGYDAEGAFWHFADTALRALTAQARLSQPKGLHSVFGAFGVEALTIQPSFSRYDGKIPVTNLARVLEGMLRSVNNLLEKFHQSYFFYIMTSTHNFVSIGVYMPAVGLILLSCLLKVCVIWINLNDTKDDTQPALAEKINFTQFVTYLVVAHLFGLIFCFVLELANAFLPNTTLNCERNVLAIALTLMIVVLCSPKLIANRKRTNDYAPTLNLVYCFSLIELALILGVTSVLNFGLGFFLSITYIPLFTLLSPAPTKRLRRVFNYAVILLLNPVFLLCISNLALEVYALSTKPNFSSSSMLFDMNRVMKRTYKNGNRAIWRIITDSYIFNSWQFTLYTIGLIPVWISSFFSVY